MYRRYFWKLMATDSFSQNFREIYFMVIFIFLHYYVTLKMFCTVLVRVKKCCIELTVTFALVLFL